MSRSQRFSRVRLKVPRRMAGLSLIELMISMVLGLVVMGAAIAIFLSNQNTFRASEGLNRIQENARVAFELMSRDVRAAGGTACSNASLVEDTGSASLQFRTSPVDGAADELIVRSGDDTAYRVIDSTANSVSLDPDQVDAASDAFSDDDLLLLCNARKTFLVQATGVAGTTVEFDALPGGYIPTDDEFAPPTAVTLARYRDVRWFVDGNGRGDASSLYVSRAGGAREEVLEGISNLGFEYLDGTSGTYQTSPAGIDVVAVRMTMTLNANDVEGREMTRTSTHVVSMRSRTL